MQKLDKQVELEGRLIRYKPIVKRIAKKNNQVGGSLNVGDHVRTQIKIMINSLDGNENRYIVLKVFPSNLRTIIIRHINGGQDICLNIDKVEKIASSAASAATVISNQESKIWEDLLQHVSPNDDDDDWFIIRNPKGEYIKVKRSGNKNSFVIINSNNHNESSNDNDNGWEVLPTPSTGLKHNVRKVKNTSTFVVNIKRSIGGNILYECPECKAIIIKEIYNRSKEFPHKEGCINIGKNPIKSNNPD